MKKLNHLYGSDGRHAQDEVEGRPVAFAFWDSPSNVIPDVCRDGLQSAVSRGGFEVFLLTFKELSAPPPAGVTIVSASQFLEAAVVCLF